MTGQWPLGELDHKDRNRHNNAWNNLREATRSQNVANSFRLRNATGFPGVKRRPNGRFVASISHQKRRHWLGSFATAEEAQIAYQAAAIKYFGEFAPS
jgi:hypothetical protein